MSDYIGWLRRRVGRDPVFLNFAGGCVVRDGQVLLQRRGDDGLWGLPGGALELGESAAEAAVREVFEETGLRVQVAGLLGVYTKYRHVYPNGDVVQPITTFFRCTVVGDRLSEDGQLSGGGRLTRGGRFSGGGGETQELRYFPMSAPPPLTNQQHVDAVEDLREGRSGVFR